jgi:hypothetical protein
MASRIPYWGEDRGCEEGVNGVCVGQQGQPLLCFCWSHLGGVGHSVSYTCSWLRLRRISLGVNLQIFYLIGMFLESWHTSHTNMAPIGRWFVISGFEIYQNS